MSRTRRPFAAATLAAAALVVLAACGGHPGTGAAAAGRSAAAASGPVEVLYAGSLTNIMENQLGPAFSRATGIAFQGYAGGSKALANEVRGRVRTGDVFVSASVDADTALRGAAGGGWVRWWATFGRSPLVLAVNPHSRFAADFRHRPWTSVLRLPGIRLGRTDPAVDPKGKLTVAALTAAQTELHLPGFAAAVTRRAQVFPEQDLVGRLQSGQLDAGFFYSLEARPLHLPTVSLSPVSAAATFTVTVLARAPHPDAAARFVAYLLGRAAGRVLAADGMRLLAPAVGGEPSAVPARLAGLLRR